MSKKKEKHYNNTIPGYQVDTGWSGDGGTRHLSMSSKQTRRVKPFDRGALSASATPPAHEVLGKCEMHGPSHRPLDNPTWHVPAAAGDHSYVPFFVARGWEERCRVRFSTPNAVLDYIHTLYVRHAMGQRIIAGGEFTTNRAHLVQLQRPSIFAEGEKNALDIA
jgi:hypothetical protein